MFEMNIQSSKLNCSSQKTFELGLRSDFNLKKNQESIYFFLLQPILKSLTSKFQCSFL